MLIKDKIIEQLSEQFPVEKNVIDIIVNHQIDSIQEALTKHKSVEISGFGKLLFNQARADKYMRQFLINEATYREALANANDEISRGNASKRLQMALKNIEMLKPKVSQDVTVE